MATDVLQFSPHVTHVEPRLTVLVIKEEEEEEADKHSKQWKWNDCMP